MHSGIEMPAVTSTPCRAADLHTPLSSHEPTPYLPRTPDQPIPDPLADPEPPFVCLDCTAEKNCRSHTLPFLNLPTELRITIYEHALLRTEPINLARKLPPVIQKITTAPRDMSNVMMLTPTRRRRHADVALAESHDRRQSHDINKEKNKRVPRTTKNPVPVKLFLLSKQVCSEALPVLYKENTFNLHLEFSLQPLTNLRQRTRSLIKHVIITISDHGDIINGDFNDMFVNGLRYCFGLRKLDIITTIPMPRDRSYDLNFHVLRWLPKSCEVEIKGQRVSDGVQRMVAEQNVLAKKLDLVSGSVPVPLPAYMRVSTYAGSSDPHDRPRPVAVDSPEKPTVEGRSDDRC